METRERGFIDSMPHTNTQQPPVAATMTINRKQKKPASAYQYYHKLVQDFDSLEREMENHRGEQSELEAQLERAKAKISASVMEEQQGQQLQWERERDSQLETLVQQRTTLDALRAQTEALEEQELRLQAEMEVLREKQQEASETEARRIRRLVHERTTLLEDELAKGKVDLDYIAQVVSAARRHELTRDQRGSQKNASSSVESLVLDVQERRRRDFEAAQENFQARMRSFQLEKNSLAQKAKDLQVSKHRALQILSQNQQLAIKGFFDAPPSAQQSEERPATPPSVDFGEILESLNQSGAQVEQIQCIDSERDSERRAFADALKQARTTLETGDQRVEAIQKGLFDRKSEAQKLGVMASENAPTAYDGAWGIESYSPRQYGTVYFVRGLVFSWADIAVVEVCAQPAKEFLQVEVRRWEATHSSVEQDRDRERNMSLAKQILGTLMVEVFAEIAEDIRLELESSCQRVRHILTSAFKNVLFPTSAEKLTPPQPKKMPPNSQAQLPARSLTLRSSLFEASLDHMRTTRNRRNEANAIAPLHQCCFPLSQSQQEVAAAITTTPLGAKSPAKKKFGLFGRSDAQPAAKELPSRHQGANGSAQETETIQFLPPDVITVAMPVSTFWRDEPHLHSRTIVSPSALGSCSCLQLSASGDLLICGTTEGELILWDLLPDQPRMLRTWTPPKAERSRVTRALLSPDAQTVLAFFRRKTMAVFAITSNAVPGTTTVPTTKPKPTGHSEDCFPVESAKFKPRSLELLMQTSAADALAELSFSPELRERAPSIVTKDAGAGWAAADLSSGSFFASFSLLGSATCNVSLLCGVSTGDLVKLNLRPQGASSGARAPSIQAAFDFPGPEDTESLNAKSIRREVFRGHRRAVLFASCFSRESSQSKVTEVLSVDQDGIVCVWKYSAATFTGFGWFEPRLRLRLELKCASTDLVSLSALPSAPKRNPSTRLPLSAENQPSDPLRGEILQVALTPDDARLVCMVFYADSTKTEVAGTLRFMQIITPTMQLDRVQLNVNFAGGNGAPRFALTSKFLLLLANNLVRVYILQTGKEARDPISLTLSGQPQLVFNNITCTTSYGLRGHTTSRSKAKRTPAQSPIRISFVVSGDQHSRLLVHSFTASISHGSSGPERKSTALDGKN